LSADRRERGPERLGIFEDMAELVDGKIQAITAATRECL
jgi:hypothetical protein